MDRDIELFENALAALRERLSTALGDLRSATTALAFCDAERQVHALALELAAEMTQRALQAASEDEMRVRQATDEVRARARQRGVQLQNIGRRKTLVRTLGGREVEVTTPYAIGKPRGRGKKTKKRGAQGTGVYPVLDQVGIVGRATPALRLLVARSVCEANSVSSARELLATGGVQIDHKAALRLTYEVTGDALRARGEAAARLIDGVDSGPFAGRRVVATIDGGRLQVRTRVGGRPKKGGRKRFVTEWREPKVLTIYVLGEDGRRDRKVPSVIDGTLGNADAAFELLVFHLRRMGAHQAAELTVVGDAASWIWKRSPQLRKLLKLEQGRFQEVIDYFHVVQRLSEFSKSQGWTDDYRAGWYATQKRRLKAGDIEMIEAVFRQIYKRDPEELAKQIAYFATHRERLRYAAFRERGLPIGSGAVESSVRRVVNLRLKGSSTFWTEEHAEGVLHLRAQAKSGRWRELEETVLGITGWRPTARLRRASSQDAA